MDMNLIAGVVVVVVLVLAGAWLLTRRRKSEHLERRFGPEYHRAVDEMGSRDKAESELAAREKRVQKLDIVALPPRRRRASRSSGGCCRRGSSTTPRASSRMRTGSSPS